MSHRRDRSPGRDIRRGAVLLAIGAWLLLGTLGDPARDYGRSWPVLLVFLGIAFLLTPVGDGGRRPGPSLIVIGALCWIAVEGAWGLDWHSVWPLFLVLAGAGLVWRAIEEQRRQAKTEDDGDE